MPFSQLQQLWRVCHNRKQLVSEWQSIVLCIFRLCWNQVCDVLKRKNFCAHKLCVCARVRYRRLYHIAYTVYGREWSEQRRKRQNKQFYVKRKISFAGRQTTEVTSTRECACASFIGFGILFVVFFLLFFVPLLCCAWNTVDEIGDRKEDTPEN